MDRREFLRFGALAAAGLAVAPLEACTRKPKADTNVASGLRTVLQEVQKRSKPGLAVAPGAGEFLPGIDQRMPFGLFKPDRSLIDGATAQMWVAKGPKSTGPLAVSYLKFMHPENHPGAEGEPGGFYESTAKFNSTGVWDVLVEAKAGQESLYGTAVLQVLAAPHVTAPGLKAVSVKTPTFQDPQGVKNVCTRDPVCPMHDVTLEQALGAGRPVVFTIASPKLCASRVCGPVVDEVVNVRDEFKDRASFIHAEPYLTDDPNEGLSPTADAWHLESEPWTFVIDRTAVVSARFEGPVVASEVKEALQRVL